MSWFILNWCLRSVFCRQVWSVCLRRNIWLHRSHNIWLRSTTTALLMATTRTWSTNARQSTLSTEDHLVLVLLDLSICTFSNTAIINSCSSITMTTSMQSYRGNTSADAASNVCKGTSFSVYVTLWQLFFTYYSYLLQYRVSLFIISCQEIQKLRF